MLSLPEGYSPVKTIDMQKNAKLAIGLNVGALVIMVLLFWLGGFFVPFSLQFESMGLLVGVPLGMLAAIFLYMVGHELVHGVFFKYFSGQKARYGFTGLYAYAKSDAYYQKGQFIVVGLAPVVLFGLLFLVLNLCLPAAWFWPVYFLQMINLSGAAGDLYVTAVLLRLPQDILVKDDGVAMTVYAPVG